MQTCPESLAQMFTTPAPVARLIDRRCRFGKSMSEEKQAHISKRMLEMGYTNVRVTPYTIYGFRPGARAKEAQTA